MGGSLFCFVVEKKDYFSRWFERVMAYVIKAFDYKAVKHNYFNLFMKRLNLSRNICVLCFIYDE